MYKNITLKKLLYSGLVLLVLAFATASVNAQTTLTTNFAVNNGNGFVTFNFTNNNAAAVTITNVGSVVNLTTGSADVSVYYKPGAINGAPGAISAANGWTQFGSATVVTNGLGTPQSFCNTSLNIPAGATYGICVNAFGAATTTGALAYSTIAAGTYTFPGGGCVLTTGDNIGYAGAGVPNAPANTPRGFVGTVTFISAVACTGTPAPGNTVATPATVCPGINFTLTPQNASTGSVTYQWQSAAALAGPYTNIAGATGSSYTGSQTVATYYRVLVTCSGNTGTSTPVLVNMTPAASCYCIPAASTCTAQDDILNVTLAPINNTSTCSANGYANYAGNASVGVGALVSGATNPISVSIDAGGNDNVGVWVDYNQNGTFDASEYTFIGNGSGVTLNGNIIIPASALTGQTRMRVRVRYATAIANTDACTTFTFGETEDYTVNITPCVPATITTPPASASVVCGNNATFTVVAAGSVPSYQWEYRTTATGIWLLVPNAAPYSGVNTATLTVAATAAQSGYQYRAVVSGACSGPDVSAAATLTVTPITLAVTPASVTKCATGAPVLLSVPSSQFTATATNNTAVAVPDNTATATTSANTIGGVPAGANIIQVDVKINMTHTYCGDMIFNLKAPNGQIIALDKYLTATANQAGTYPNIGFVNTIISSNGVNALSTAAVQPITGTFKADIINGTITGTTVQNPTGYVSAATSWAQLASTTQSPNGVWTLAMADGGAGDVGTLTSWTITVTYGGAPATAVFSPVTGLYTNAAGTTAYTGTAVTQVYANPAANTTYTAVVSAGACNAVPQTIPVNVNSPVGGTATLANSTICAGTNTTFALGGTLTGGPGFTHNFQVSTNNGVSYTNITNGGVYSGANTNTLVLTGVPYSSNGYKFRDSINTGGGCGSLISTVATLTVNPTPVVTISAAPVTHLYPGLTSTLTATTTSATAPVTYQWYLNGVAVPGATTNKYIVDVDHEGKYTVKATDANGCSAAAGTSTPGFITIGDSANVTILFIYPSPNSGKFQVRYFNDINNGGTAPAFVNVYDSKGVRVFTRNYTLGAGYQAMNVNLGNHAKGLYRVELVDLNGNRIKTGSAMVF